VIYHLLVFTPTGITARVLLISPVDVDVDCDEDVDDDDIDRSDVWIYICNLPIA
jgi:hypothetical protein